MQFKKTVLIFIIACLSLVVDGQVINGFVQDANNVPIPFVTVYVKHMAERTETDIDGRYSLKLDPGDYELVFDLMGFQQKTVQVFLTKQNQVLVKNIWLQPADVLNEVVIKKNRRDPAYAIMAKAIARRKQNEGSIQSITREVYIKAKEVITEEERKKRNEKSKKKKANLDSEKEKVDAQNYDPFKEKREQNKKLANSVNLVETQITSHFEFPNKLKEIKNAYKKYGSEKGLYYLSTTEEDMNWYNGLVSASTLAEGPFISPLNATAVLSYKFKLISQTMDDSNRFVYKIKITPRKKGNTTVTGFLWITDQIYNLAKVDLELPKGGLLFYDYFRIQQVFKEIADSTWGVVSQEFNYQTRMGRQSFKGNTQVDYTEFILNPEFPKRFFGNELGAISKEAFERDSSYWSKMRPKPLTEEEQKILALKDSIEAVETSEHYLDSIDKAANKITLARIMWDGVGHRNRVKKSQLEFGSITDWVKLFDIGGYRYGPYLWYYKKWENERALIINPEVDIGIRNKDVKGDFYFSYLHNPYRQTKISGAAGREFDMFTYNDGVYSLFNRANWVDQIFGTLETRTELFNGFYINIEGSFLERRPLTGYEFSAFTDTVVPNNQPLDFETNQALIGTLSFHYTPFQKYVREPHRKVVLGSKWPQFSFYIEHGFKNLLKSDVDFTYLAMSVRQDVKVRSLGTSTYKIKGGKFINSNTLTYTDEKIFPRGDRFFFSSPMWSFQLQDTTLLARDLYFELHYLHHFNGALINNIPFLKKTGITFSAGGGALYIKEYNYFYKEAFAGVVRSFRIQRQRFRLGYYVVIGDSNFGKAVPALKFSFSMYSIREKKWGF